MKNISLSRKWTSWR